MFFSRKTSSDSPSPPGSPGAAAAEQVPVPASPTPDESQRTTPIHMSTTTSEGYPSWLPKRPAPPAPQSTFQSSRSNAAGTGAFPPSSPMPPTPPMTTMTPEQVPFLGVGGRKPTPRSVRIVSMPDSALDDMRREPTDHTRVGSNPISHPRVWSRATGPTMSPTMFSTNTGLRPLKPKFRSNGLNLDLLRDPSLKSHLYFYIYPILVFAHIPLQTFFDFNAVFILIQVSKFPNPVAPGVPGSGRNWSLGAAAYIACWLVWILVVFLIYEVIYSFARRWRLKRPLILPIYLSSPAFNLAACGSYPRFCFLQHIRWSAFSSSLRTGIAESCFFYSQNLANVALLLPRAGLSLALLLSFSDPNPELRALADTGATAQSRDSTFFNRGDGTLTDYARGVLIANAAWTAWRVLLLLASYIGLWLLSGYTCGGICGPRYRWEEEDANEKRALSIYSDVDSDIALSWSWKEDTKQRIQDAFEFCASIRSIRAHGKEKMISSDDRMLMDDSARGGAGGGGFEGIEKVMAAIGLGGGGNAAAAQAARRGVLSEDFFAPSPVPPGTPSELAEGVLPTTMATMRVPPMAIVKDERPLKELPYPFTVAGAHASSEDQRVPFPPSPHPSGRLPRGSGSHSHSHEEEEEEEEEEEGEEGLEDDEDEGEEDEEEGLYEVETGYGDEDASAAISPSSAGRASGSMSSLGQPIGSRYPFAFRRPGRGGSTGSSSAAMSSSVGTRPSHGHLSTPSHGSSRHTRSHTTSSKSPGNTTATTTGTTSSSGNRSSGRRYGGGRVSLDSHGSSPFSVSAQSHSQSQSQPSSPGSHVGGIPMPPRHPGRARAGTIPVPSSGGASGALMGMGGMPASPTPAAYRGGYSSRMRTRERARSNGTHGTEGDTFGPLPLGGTYGDDSDHYDTSGSGGGMGPYGGDVTLDTFAESDVIEEEGGVGGGGEDILGLLSSEPSEAHPQSSSASPASSLAALRQRASTSFTSRHHHHHRRQQQQDSRTNSQSSSSGSQPTRSRRGSGLASSPPRSRTQSLIQSIQSITGNFSHSSLELAAAASRLRHHASMTRLEEDMGSSTSASASASPPSRGHSHSNSNSNSNGNSRSRSGSGTTGSDVLLSGGSSEGGRHDHTFGQPYPYRGQQGQAQMHPMQDVPNRVSEEDYDDLDQMSDGEGEGVVPNLRRGGEEGLRNVRSSETVASGAPSEITMIAGSPTMTIASASAGPAQQQQQQQQQQRGDGAELETIHEPVDHHDVNNAQSAPIPIPIASRATLHEDPAVVAAMSLGTSGSASASASGGMWSSAPQSFITPPATVEGETTTTESDGGREREREQMQVQMGMGGGWRGPA